jgi:cell division protein FtsW (lipid II flippase)
MTASVLAARVPGLFPGIRAGGRAVSACQAAGYGLAALGWLAAGRYQMASHLGDSRISVPVMFGSAGAVALIVLAAASRGRRAAGHLAGAAAMLSVAGITLAYRFSVSDGRHQLVAGMAAGLVFLAVRAVGQRCGGWFALRRARRLLVTGGLLLIASPLLPVIGASYGGARLWLSLPGLSLEPGQIGAVAVTVALALGLAADGDLLGLGGRRGWRDAPGTLVATAVGAAAAIVLTVLCHDLGGATVLAAATVALLAAGSHRVRYPAVVMTALIAGAVFAWPHMAYVRARFAEWQHPLAQPDGTLTQAAAARYALAWGGLIGHGLGSGMIERSGSLPAARSDYALVQLSAEDGAIVAVIVIGMLAVTVVAAWVLVRSARPGDDQLVALGAATLLTLPSVLLVAGVTGLIPLTGTPFLLFGTGTSAALAGALAAGLLTGAADNRVPASRLLTPPGGLAALQMSPALVALTMAVILAVSSALLVGEASTPALAQAAGNPELDVAAVTLRGRILTADGVVLATSVHTGSLDTALRRYAGPGLDPADVTGVAVPDGGASGLEAAQSALLRCGAGAFAGTSITPDEALRSGATLLGPDVNPATCTPANIVTTIEAPVQRAAVSALAGHHGVVVALDADTGALLAVAANPTVNVNTAVTPNVGADLARLAHLPMNLAGAARSPLYLPAFEQAEPPGSVFKLLLGLAATAAGVSTDTVPESSVPIVGRDGQTASLANAGGEFCGGDLTEILTVSCNTGAAQLAARAGRPAYERIISELGLTAPTTISGVPAFAGTVGLAPADSSAQLAASDGDGAAPLPGDLAETAIGQASVRLTPVSVATLTADILTGSSSVRPYLAVAACDGATPIAAFSAPRDGRALPGAAADWPGMAGDVRTGTASALQRFAAPVARLLVGAKTGTAQLPDGAQIAWIAAAVRYRTGQATRMAIVVAMVLPDAAVPDPVGGINAAMIAGPVLTAAAAHPPADAVLNAGRSTGAAELVCHGGSFRPVRKDRQ